MWKKQKMSKNLIFYSKAASRISEIYESLDKAIAAPLIYVPRKHIAKAKEDFEIFRNSVKETDRIKYTLVQSLEDLIGKKEEEIEKRAYIPTINLRRHFSELVRRFEAGYDVFENAFEKEDYIGASSAFLTMLDCLDTTNRSLPNHYHWAIGNMREIIESFLDSFEEKGICPAHLWDAIPREKEEEVIV